jgi:hypothetical protein
MKLVEVDPDEIPYVQEGRRGRISYPILKMFLESGATLVKLDRTGMTQSLQSITTSLATYIRGHGLPVRNFCREGEIYLLRTDTNEKGRAEARALDGLVRDHKRAMEEAAKSLDSEIEKAPPISEAETLSRFEQEKDRSLK